MKLKTIYSPALYRDWAQVVMYALSTSEILFRYLTYILIEI
jgi:hypothetical protein